MTRRGLASDHFFLARRALASPTAHLTADFLDLDDRQQIVQFVFVQFFLQAP